MYRAAASHDTLVAVTIAVLAGGALLLPSLAFLFRLALGGSLVEDDATARSTERGHVLAPPLGLLARSSGAALLTGVAFLTFADAGWAHGLGVASLGVFAITAFGAIVGDAVAEQNSE